MHLVRVNEMPIKYSTKLKLKHKKLWVKLLLNQHFKSSVRVLVSSKTHQNSED
eukprot:UN02639